MKVIGIVGGIASGKSTLLKKFKYLKAKTIEMDKIGHEIVEENKLSISKVFGEKTIVNGKLDRKKLGQIVFSSKEKLKVGMYAGSFNPFHVGHLNICQMADKIFDKVIISIGINPEKNNKQIICKFPKNYQKTSYKGLLTDHIKELEKEYNWDITLIRGLRNGMDLQYESNQLTFMTEIFPNLKYIMLLGDKKFEHISSSSIRNLLKIDKKIAERYLINE